MRQVMLALLPGIAAMTWFFGLGVLVNIVVAVIAAIAFEAAMLAVRGRPVSRFLADNTAIVTAILFALCLPPTVPWWVTVVGIGFGIVLAKQLYGGIGQNPFNPAMVAYVVVIICFPAELTLWLEPSLSALSSLDPITTVEQIFTKPAAAIDAYTAATPLADWDVVISKGTELEVWRGEPGTEQAMFAWAVIALAYLLGGLYLIWRKVAAWQTPLAMLLGVTLLSTALWLANDALYLPPWEHLLLGSVMIGAFFIVTDPVSGCTTTRGRWVFGIGAGVLVVVIRSWSNYPEGVAFAVLLMNVAAPLIDYYSKPRVYGYKAIASAKKSKGAS